MTMLLTQKHRKRRFANADEGVALVEFALVLPLLVLLAIGIIEVGRYIAFSVRIASAVRAGAQIGAAGGSAWANAAPNASQPYATTTDSLASQAACIDSNFSSTISGFSCTSTGTLSNPPKNTLIVKTVTSCTNPNTSTNCPNYIQVSAAGKFPSLIHYPLLPDDITISASTIMQVDQ